MVKRSPRLKLTPTVTQQKVFYWLVHVCSAHCLLSALSAQRTVWARTQLNLVRFSVPHDRLFLDALERDLKREKIGQSPTTEVTGEPARSFRSYICSVAGLS